MKPLVSILIPAYNSQQWIADTLRSAIAQTWPRKEIIVVDDGSTDQTLAIARGFASDGVHVVTQTNQGASAARNTAFSLSQGDYIQWLDADDLIAPNKITSQMEVLDHPSSKLTLTSGPWGRFMYRSNRAKFVPTSLWSDLSPVDWLIRKMGQNLHMQTGTWLVSRELTQAAGPWDTRLVGDDDGEYFCRVLLASNGVRFVPDAKVYYRELGAASLSYIGFSSKKLDAQWFSMKAHIGYLRSLEESERVRVACVQYMQNWMVFFLPERPDIFEEAAELAKVLGGKLNAPTFSWKYAWIKVMFGVHAAKRAQVFFPRTKWSMITWWDKMLFRIENRSQANEQFVRSKAEHAQH
jgi:glycosyltransferase involved in cell wall biosynthesis